MVSETHDLTQGLFDKNPYEETAVLMLTNSYIVKELTHICNVKFMIVLVKPTTMISMVGFTFIFAFSVSCLQWSTSFYKHLCSCMIFKVEKIQRRLRNMDIYEAHKLLDEINGVSFFLLL